MAGHSKWSNIQHRKGKQDAKRGKLFTKLIREITVAAKMGGSDPDANPRLRLAIEKARSNSLPKDTMERAIKRGAGNEDDSNFFEIRYEGYGPAGVAVMVECLTDNKNRTVAEVRHAFTKSGGNLGTDGSVSYLFTKTGLMNFASGDEDQIMEAALEAGAEDVVVNDDGTIDVMTNANDFVDVKEALIKAGLEPTNAEVTMIASTDVKIDDQDTAEKMIRLSDTLEDLDDVQQVYSNADIDEAILDQL